MLDAWNENCGALTKAEKLTPERAKNCRKRMRDADFVARFAVAVRKAAAHPWPEWRPSFDYFIANGTNYLKVLEGKFDHWRDAQPQKRVDTGLGPQTTSTPQGRVKMFEKLIRGIRERLEADRVRLAGGLSEFERKQVEGRIAKAEADLKIYENNLAAAKEERAQIA